VSVRRFKRALKERRIEGIVGGCSLQQKILVLEEQKETVVLPVELRGWQGGWTGFCHQTQGLCFI
jgi:hypothetical protein